MLNWNEIWDLKATVNKALEPYKAQKIKPIDLHLEIILPLGHSALCYSLDGLADIFGVSTVETKEGTEIIINVTKPEGTKCDRCHKWFKYYESVTYKSLCERCDRVMHMLNWDKENLHKDIID